MKKLFTSALMVFAAITTQANHLNSELLLSSSSNELIVATLDNEIYNHPQAYVEFRDLQPGMHSLTVSRVINNRHARRPVTRMLYSGSIFIPEASRITAQVERGFALHVTEVVPILFASGWNQPVPVSQSGFQPVCAALQPMDCHTFDQLVRSIECKSFESSRFQVACQAAAVNYFTSEQVAELLTKFTFESTRLDFAKLAYARTLDKNRYFLVNDAFAFESSIDELNAYILYRS